MTAPEQVYDIELESALDDEAMCCVEDAPATHLSSHDGQCFQLVCPTHADEINDLIAQSLEGRRRLYIDCTTCGAKSLNPRTVSVRPV